MNSDFSMCAAEVSMDSEDCVAGLNPLGLGSYFLKGRMGNELSCVACGRESWGWIILSLEMYRRIFSVIFST